jgi:hypothetical protein
MSPQSKVVSPASARAISSSIVVASPPAWSPCPRESCHPPLMIGAML